MCVIHARPSPSSQVFFEYVTKSYRHFLSGDDRLCESLDQELGRRFADRTADREAQGARLREENAQLRWGRGADGGRSGHHWQ